MQLHFKKNASVTIESKQEITDCNVSETKDHTLCVISEITDAYSFFLTANARDKWIRIDGQYDNPSDLMKSKIANHISELCPELHLVTMDRMSQLFIDHTTLPIVFIPFAKTDIAETLAGKLFTQGYVVKSRSKEDDKKMNGILSYKFGNVIFIIYPGNNHVKIHPIIDYSDEVIINNICNEIYTYTEHVKIPKEERFEIVLQNIYKENLLNKHEEVNSDLDSIIKENTEQKDEIQKLRRENLALKASAAGSEKAPILYYGEETDLYEGEIKDYLLELVDEKLKNLNASRLTDCVRQYDVLKSILDENKYEGSHQKKREEIKNLLVGYRDMDAKTRSRLEDIGFTIDHDRHNKLKYYGDNRYETTIPSSSSDVRAWKNACSIIRNRFL